MKTYTIGQVSKLSGVSVRTLHYYDEKNLLKARRSSNRYRFYCAYDVALLQQIIIYRQMDMSLDEIANIILNNDFDLLGALQKQRNLLIQRRNDTNDMIKRIEVTIKMANGEENLDTLLAGLPEAKITQWKSDIKQDEYADEVFEAYGNISQDDMHSIKQVADEWTEQYKNVTHLPVEHERVQAIIKEAYIMMNQMYNKILDEFDGISCEFLNTITREGRKDKVTVDIYETYQTGLAKHYFDAMDYFSEHLLKENEEAFMQLR